ncbi:MAG TPA: methyltransferase, partial [Bacteroidales bacterium]|nr:methyltransferase [Bacteroidales bacterium]
MKAEKLKQIRFKKTISFFKKVEPNCKHILDLGVQNELSNKFALLGYNVQNTQGEDLDLEPELLKNYKDAEVITAFEILEHLVSPYVLLKNLPADR